MQIPKYEISAALELVNSWWFETEKTTYKSDTLSKFHHKKYIFWKRPMILLCMENVYECL